MRLNETSHTDALDEWSALVIKSDLAVLYLSKKPKQVESQHFQSLSLGFS